MTTARALVVDDDAQILRAVRTGLQARGFEALTAGSGWLTPRMRTIARSSR